MSIESKVNAPLPDLDIEKLDRESAVKALADVRARIAFLDPKQPKWVHRDCGLDTCVSCKATEAFRESPMQKGKSEAQKTLSVLRKEQSKLRAQTKGTPYTTEDAHALEAARRANEETKSNLEAIRAELHLLRKQEGQLVRKLNKAYTMQGNRIDHWEESRGARRRGDKIDPDRD